MHLGNVFNSKTIQADYQIEPRTQHPAQRGVGSTLRSGAGQSQQAFRHVLNPVSMEGGQAGASREGSLHQGVSFLAHHFSNAVRIQRLGQAVTDQVFERNRPATFIRALDAQRQATGFLGIQFCITFSNQDP